MEGDFAALLKFAELIQTRMKVEKENKAKESLINDLKLIKDEIGRMVLSLPPDAEIHFPDPAEDQPIPPVSAELSHVNEDVDISLPMSSLEESISEASTSAVSVDDISARFSAFLKAKQKAKAKSKIPVPQSRNQQ